MYKHRAAEQDCHVDVRACCLRYGPYERQRDDGEINDREDSQVKVKMKRDQLLENELNERQLGFCGDQGTKTHVRTCTYNTQEKEM